MLNNEQQINQAELEKIQSVLRFLTKISSGHFLLLVTWFIPFLIIFMYGLSFLMQDVFYGWFLENAITNTPCFLNTRDYSALGLIREFTHGHVLLSFQSRWVEGGWQAVVAAYVGVLCYVAFFQILINAILYNSKLNIREYLKPLPVIGAISVLMVAFCFSVLLKNGFYYVDMVYQHNQQQTINFERLAMKKIAPNVPQDVIVQCTYSNQVHLIPDGEHSYFGLH